MHIYDRFVFWGILGLVTPLVIGFITWLFTDGETAGTAAAISIIVVAAIGAFKIISYQYKNK
jgi:hypothetical protein